MDSDPTSSRSKRRMIADRRSGADTRSEAEKQVIGDRRSGLDRRSEQAAIQSVVPSSEQVALFSRRLRRALASDKGRHFFGVAQGEYEFSTYPDVLRTLEWLESLAKASGDAGQDRVL